jgi:FKBP-type peptidyl-prolyl cis-trans isomerase SlpA
VQITIGSSVTMHFSLTLADGMLVESSFNDQPVSFVLGDGSIDKGLELALIGLRAGDRQRLTLMPGQAFGERDKSAIQTVPKSRFPEDIDLEPGQIIGFSGENGEEIAGAIVSVEDQDVSVDFNHPLAGREVSFDVQILSVENPPAG